MITIYGSNNSRATRCLWVLEELGVPYTQEKVNADGRNKSPEYLAINPAGKVPSMTDDDGNVAMFETCGINLYIAQRYGAGKLWPTDPAGQAKCLQWSFFAATELEGFVVTMLVERVFKPEAARNEEVAKAAADALVRPLNTLEGLLAGKTYLLGDTFTIADLQVAASLGVIGRTGFDMTPYPNITKWLATCQARDAAKKIAALPRP